MFKKLKALQQVKCKKYETRGKIDVSLYSNNPYSILLKNLNIAHENNEH